jgi:hypothetical protein
MKKLALAIFGITSVLISYPQSYAANRASSFIDGQNKKFIALAPHPSKYVTIVNNQYTLKPEYQKGIRKTFYGTSYRTAVETWKKEILSTPKGKKTPSGYDGIQDPSDSNKYWSRGQYWLNSGTTTIATIEHTTPVVTHWNGKVSKDNTCDPSGGCNKPQSDRLDFYSKISGLEILPKSLNSSEGAALKEDEGYSTVVGPNFRGSGE